MTVAELKDSIANLPDDMEVIVDIEAESHPIDGLTSNDITTEICNNKLYINAIVDYL